MSTDDEAAVIQAQAEAKRLWLQLVEKEARCRRLEALVQQLQSSRSWRITAPLRALVEFAKDHDATSRRPLLQQGATAGVVQPWQKRLAEVMQERGLQAWLETPDATRRYLVDVTELALEDLGAGVQRVTRSWLSELLLSPPPDFGIEPVRLCVEGGYVLARSFLARFLGLQELELGPDLPLQLRAGDVFVGLDFCRDRATQLDPALARLQAAGVPISLVVPDVLPLQHPEWFPAGIGAAFAAWLEVCVHRADQVVCISDDSLQAFKAVLQGRPELQGLRVVVVPLGGDLPPAAPASLPTRQPGSARLLMVGTVEPRKRYPQALDAFEMLAGMGEAVDLMIVGHRGWESEAFFQRLMRHPQAGRSLHWLEDADDATLAAAYRDSDLLVMASSGEGYGLPVIEAARAGCRLLLRDLPVFREVAGDAACYFSGEQGAELAHAIRDAIRHPMPPQALRSRSWPSWQYSAFMLKNETISG